MVRWLAPALVLLVASESGLAQRQAPTQEELRAKYEEKLTHDYISYGGWLIDYDEARAKATAEGKWLFAYFSRSYSP